MHTLLCSLTCNQPHPVKITFGFTKTTQPDTYGLMLYHHNRLIRAYEKIGCQKQQAKNQGVGVLGVVEADFLTPVHNKQGFADREKYRTFMQNAGLKLNDYYFEKRGHGEGTDGASSNANSQAVASESPWTWAQCDNCLHWRRLPTGYTDTLPDKWFCRLNPDAHFNRCDIPEEPEDEDEALKTSYIKTNKKNKREVKKSNAEEEINLRLKEQMLQIKAEDLRKKEMEFTRRQNLAVKELVTIKCGTKRHNQGSVVNIAKALKVNEAKLAKKEETIKHLEYQEILRAKKEEAMLSMANQVIIAMVEPQSKMVQEQSETSVETSSLVTPGSTGLNPPAKRRGTVAPDGDGSSLSKVMRLQLEDGSLTTIPSHAADIGVSSVPITAPTQPEQTHVKAASKAAGDSQTKSSDPCKSKPPTDARLGNQYTGMTAADVDVKPDTAELNAQMSDNSKSAAQPSTSKSGNEPGEIKVKVEVKKEMDTASSQTVPVIIKVVSPEEEQLLSLSPVDQRNMLLQKSRELDDTSESLGRLQMNIWKLLKIIVSDFDYGEPEDIEKVILEFIKQDEREST